MDSGRRSSPERQRLEAAYLEDVRASRRRMPQAQTTRLRLLRQAAELDRLSRAISRLSEARRTAV